MLIGEQIRLRMPMCVELHHLALDGRSSTIIDAGWLRAGQYFIALRTTSGAVSLKSFIKL